jgi:hypothetical protein
MNRLNLLVIPLLLGLSACTTVKNSPALNPGQKPSQTAQKFFVERTQVLTADYLLYLPEGYDP